MNLPRSTTMTNSIRATFKSSRWDETPVEGDDPIKLSRVSSSQTYTGDIAGDSTLEYVMAYGEDGDASFVGLERIVGTVDGRRGSFALRHEGTYSGGQARIRLSVVEGAGTGDLAGLAGSGSFEAAHAEQYELELGLSFGD